MQACVRIQDIKTREILDARGALTLEIELKLENGIVDYAVLDLGKANAVFEGSIENEKKERVFGYVSAQLADVIQEFLISALKGKNVFDQVLIDDTLAHLSYPLASADIGNRLSMGISTAVAKAAAQVLKMSNYHYLGGRLTHTLPVPFVTIFKRTDFLDSDLNALMLVPVGAVNLKEALQMCLTTIGIFKHLLAEKKGAIKENKQILALTIEDILSLLVEAMIKGGYRPGHHMRIALDMEGLFTNDRYYLKAESQVQGRPILKTSQEMVDFYENLVNRFPILSITDGLAKEDWGGWTLLTKRLGYRIQLIGGKLFKTQGNLLEKGKIKQVANAILVRPLALGTLTNLFAFIRQAQLGGYAVMLEGENNTLNEKLLIDIAMAGQVGQIKLGLMLHDENIVKYNRLLQIEEELKDTVRYEGLGAFFNLK